MLPVFEVKKEISDDRDENATLDEFRKMERFNPDETWKPVLEQ